MMHRAGTAVAHTGPGPGAVSDRRLITRVSTRRVRRSPRVAGLKSERRLLLIDGAGRVLGER